MIHPKYTLLGAFAAGALLLIGCPGGKTTGPAPTPVPPENPSAGGPTTDEPPTGPAVRQTTLAEVGLDPGKMDPSADPCEDFFQYACGTWVAKTEIPADRSGYGTFHMLDEQSEKTLHGLLEDIVASPGDEPRRVRLATFYKTCMDEAAIEKAGAKPLAPWLKKIDGVKDKKTLLAVLVEMHASGMFPVWNVDSEQDLKEATVVVAWLDQSGLGLPDRDYYTVDNDKMKDIRAKYVAHVERMLVLSGMKPAQAKKAAADVMELETALAKMQMTKVERRSPENLYHKVTLDELAKDAPGIDWKAYFGGVGADVSGYLIVTSPTYIKGAVELFTKSSPVTVRAYLRWHLVRAAAPQLSKAFVDESFALTQVLTGQPELEPRWKRCVGLTERLLGEDLGQEYVKVAFSGEAKQHAEGLMLAVKAAFAENLAKVDWMDDATRTAARQKLDMMVYKIGYPVKWRVYDFQVTPDSHAGNVNAGSRFAMSYRMGKIGKPVDRDEWHMTPSTVNAYYNPVLNEMVFPAGILQPPFFAAGAAIAVNAGAIGMVMGHELTHGFDDEGSKFAGDGNLKPWWPDNARKAFDERTQCVVKKYEKYEPLPGEHLNGQLTLGENIADLGGVKLAFFAYRSLRAGAGEVWVADGLSEDQMFFVAAGQAWCTKRREEDERRRLTVDPHSMPKYRVNGSLSNLPEFHQAFKCKAGQKMVPAPEQMCKVW
jgi:putative endopeptidase